MTNGFVLLEKIEFFSSKLRCQVYIILSSSFGTIFFLILRVAWIYLFQTFAAAYTKSMNAIVSSNVGDCFSNINLHIVIRVAWHGPTPKCQSVIKSPANIEQIQILTVYFFVGQYRRVQSNAEKTFLVYCICKTKKATLFESPQLRI